MAETIMCTECDAKLKVATMPPAGRKIRCPKCGEPFFPKTQKPDDDEEKDLGDNLPARKTSRSVDKEDDYEAPRRSRRKARSAFEFDGTAGDFFMVYLLTILLTVITFGLAFPWTCCMFEKWKTEHTLVNGRRLSFNGTG